MMNKTIYFNRLSFSTKIFLVFIFSLSIISVLFLLNQSIRLDEAQSIWAATKPIKAIFDYAARDVHVPLYFLLLHFWIQFFGSDIVSARLLSLIFFLATIPVLYFLTKTLSNRRTAFLTISLFSLSPFILWYSSEARMYTLFTFITTLNSYFFIRYFLTDGQKGKIEYFLTSILGIYTHYFFLFLIVSQIFFIIGRAISIFYFHRHYNSVLLHKIVVQQLLIIFQLLILLSLTFVLFSPWLFYVYYLGAAANTQPQIPPPTGYSLLQAFSLFLFGFQPEGLQSVFISFWPLLVMLFLFVFTQRRSIPVPGINYVIVATFLPVALVFIVSFFRPIFLARYLILVTPTLFFLLSWFLMNYSKKLALYLSGFLLFVLILFLLVQNFSDNTPAKENYEQVSNYLEQHADPQDIIVVSAPFTVYPIEYTYNGRARIETIPEWDRFNQGAIPAYTQESLEVQLERYKTQYVDMFLVLSYDQGYQNDLEFYLDNNLERLAIEQFSEDLEVRVYRLRYDIPEQLKVEENRED